ncbi:hypothetical protein T439DRAFT_383314 [Meredithblackwellia eburnea MCA 4105]
MVYARSKRSSTMTVILPLFLFATSSLAHMSIWTTSMYGVGQGFQYAAENPIDPLGPNWDQDAWWFRGPAYRALSPAARGSTDVTELPAGGEVTIEISCHIAWTSFGCCQWMVAYYNAQALDACPGIADVDDISKVTMDNLAIFTVQHECVVSEKTTFEIPAMMPACTGAKCICAWFWLAMNGTGNFYMTGFDCAVTGASPLATAIAPPVDPTWCAPGDTTCVTQAGSKRPLYAYNTPTNIVWRGNYDRPGYHDNWSFKNGPQNDIFLPAKVVSSSSAISSSAVASSKTVSSSAVPSSSKPASSSAASSSASKPASSSASASSSKPQSSSSKSASSSSAASSSKPVSSSTISSSSTSSIKPSSSSSASSSKPLSSSVAGSSSKPASSSAASSSAFTYPTATAQSGTVNIARLANNITASSFTPGSPPTGVNDGNIGGVSKSGTGVASQEWKSLNQKAGAWVQLNFTAAYLMRQVVLYGSVNTDQQILAGTLAFSDGTIVTVGSVVASGTKVALPGAGVTASSLRFTVTSVSTTTTAVGLAELQLFNAPVTSRRDVAFPESPCSPGDQGCMLVAEHLFDGEAMHL